MKRIVKKPTLDHLLTYKSIRWTSHLGRNVGKSEGRVHPESNINSDHDLPLLDLCWAYVGDGPGSAEELAKYAGSSASLGSYGLYDVLLDKLLVVDDCFLNLGCAVNPSPRESEVGSGDKGFPG